jgi:hypothetical protein
VAVIDALDKMVDRNEKDGNEDSSYVVKSMKMCYCFISFCLYLNFIDLLLLKL